MKKLSFVMYVMLGLTACATLPTSAEYLLRGDGYFKDGNYAKAIEAYNRAISLNPSNLEAYASRGTAHYFAGHYELAQQDYEFILDKNPYQTNVYTAYGSALAARGDYENALAIFNFAIRVQPNKPENYFSRAGVYFMLGRFQEALADYTTVLDSYPAVEVYNARGAVYLYQGKKDLAEADFQAAKAGNIPETLQVYSMIK